MRKILDVLSSWTNVKDLVYIHVGASEMLHFVTNDEFTICHNRMDFPQEIGTQHDKWFFRNSFLIDYNYKDTKRKCVCQEKNGLFFRACRLNFAQVNFANCFRECFLNIWGAWVRPAARRGAAISAGIRIYMRSSFIISAS